MWKCSKYFLQIAHKTECEEAGNFEISCGSSEEPVESWK